MDFRYAPDQDCRFPIDHYWRSSACEADLQNVPRTVSVLRAHMPTKNSTAWHSHTRDELLCSIRGVMTVAFERTTWIVPEGHGILVPAGVRHRASCPAALAMCAAYFDDACLDGRASSYGRLLRVSPLLDACLRALAEEPVLYERDGRGGALARLIADEARKAPDALFPLPMPADKRLQKLCDSLQETPALALDIDAWAETVGMSRRTMTRRFRAETGLSFADWRRRLRALRALTQQAEGTPPQMAAKANGYASAAALQAMIRRATSEPR